MVMMYDGDIEGHIYIIKFKIWLLIIFLLLRHLSQGRAETEIVCNALLNQIIIFPQKILNFNWFEI